jgi:exodeoxyribonuclease VII large subunit
MAETRSLFDGLTPREPRTEPAERARPPAAEEPAPVPSAPAKRAPARVFSVAELTLRLRGALEALGRVSVEGEVSRITRAASGHCYFDLKDEEARLACVVWRANAASALRFELEEGMRVVAHGRLDVYPPRGTYTLAVQRLEPSGVGLLLAQFEALKADLKRRGWFDRKRPLPVLPRAVGVVTSRDGAALRDFLRTRSKRWPLYPVRLAHAPVQGPTAAIELARAIERLDRSGVEVIALIRGGGSLEDLWAFNELPLAAAIRACSVPVVSGVGHESDTTLADLVADHRAHTPTDAAQVLFPDRAELEGRLTRLWSWLLEALDGALARAAERLERATRSRVLADPRWIAAEREQRLLHVRGRLEALLSERLARSELRAASLHRRLGEHGPRAELENRARRLERGAARSALFVRRALERRERRQELAAAKLHAFSPIGILARGYSITTREGERTPLLDPAVLSPGERIATRLAGGSVVSRVTEVSPTPPDPPQPGAR